MGAEGGEIVCADHSLKEFHWQEEQQSQGKSAWQSSQVGERRPHQPRGGCV